MPVTDVKGRRSRLKQHARALAGVFFLGACKASPDEEMMVHMVLSNNGPHNTDTSPVNDFPSQQDGRTWHEQHRGKEREPIWTRSLIAWQTHA